jgi:hypothetical protein
VFARIAEENRSSKVSASGTAPEAHAGGIYSVGGRCLSAHDPIQSFVAVVVHGLKIVFGRKTIVYAEHNGAEVAGKEDREVFWLLTTVITKRAR